MNSEKILMLHNNFLVCIYIHTQSKWIHWENMANTSNNMV